MAATKAAHVHIEGIQTAVPTRVVERGRTRLVAVAAPPLAASAVQRRFRVVLYYRAGTAAADGSAWEDGVWVRESLCEAVADHPEMAGRLRRRDDGSWEVKLTDTGVRFVQATVEGTVDDFVGAKDRERKEAALAHWTDVCVEDPDLCPPFFVQLTRFQGDGGCAIGISCALLLADPLSLSRFLQSWARTNARMQAENKLAEHPMMQYMAYFQRPNARRKLKSVPLDSFAEDGGLAMTVLFRTHAAAGADDHCELARACVDKASQKLGAGKVSRFSIVAAGGGDGPAGKTSIETCIAADVGGEGAAAGALDAAQWSELGLEELPLRDRKPVHVSYNIVTDVDEGLVVLMPDGDGFLVAATVPK